MALKNLVNEIDALATYYESSCFVKKQVQKPVRTIGASNHNIDLAHSSAVPR